MKLPSLLVAGACGVLVGLGLAAGGLIATIPHLMINVVPSSASVDATVDRLSEAARARGWVVSGVRSLDRSVSANGGPALPQIRLLELCQATHAGAILDDDGDRRYAAMMPCTVAVYETDSGTRVSSLNAALLGPLLGGEVGQIMGGQVSREQKAIIVAALANKGSASPPE